MTTGLPEPELSPESGWTALVDLMAFVDYPSFVAGDPTGDRIRVGYYRRDADNAVVGKAWFGQMTEGPPGHAHGGSVSALLDEAMGFSGWLAGYSVVAAKLTVNFRQMVPLGKEVQFEAHVEGVEGRKVTTRGQLTDGQGTVYADADGLFLNLDFRRLGLPDTKLPEKTADKPGE